MIDLLRLKALGTGLAFGYAIVKNCDNRFQAHCRRHPGQVTFYSYRFNSSINALVHRKVALCLHCLHCPKLSSFFQPFNAAIASSTARRAGLCDYSGLKCI